MSAQHTPGPWEAFYKSKYGEWHVSVPIAGSNMKWAIFDDGIRTENPEADARLIAAAPDLLEALEFAVYEQFGDVPVSYPLSAWIIKAQAAISKARGGQE
jgi:hypothetical protein